MHATSLSASVQGLPIAVRIENKLANWVIRVLTTSLLAAHSLKILFNSSEVISFSNLLVFNYPNFLPDKMSSYSSSCLFPIVWLNLPVLV